MAETMMNIQNGLTGVHVSKTKTFMELANIDLHTIMDWSDFDDIVKFLELNLDSVIEEVHYYGSDHRTLHDGKTKVYCPFQPNLPHHPVDVGILILEVTSEKHDTNKIMKRTIKVLDLGTDPDNEENHLIEIHEDIAVVTADDECVAANDLSPNENVATVSICRKEYKPKYFQGH